jgi:CheY-like chemotaxis protein
MSLDTSAPAQQAEIDNVTAPASARRILVADDDAPIRALLSDLLGQQGYEVIEAKSGAEVLRVVPQL